MSLTLVTITAVNRIPVLRKIYITTSAAGLLFATLAVYVKTADPAVIDSTVLAFMDSHATAFATTLFQCLTWAGSIFILVPLAAVTAFLLFVRVQRAEALMLISGLAIAAIVGRILKYLFSRERPDLYPALVDTYTDLAFPSVHVTQISVYCLLLFMVLRIQSKVLNIMLAMMLLMLVLGVAISRLYLQVHYPTDIIGGLLLGVTCAGIAGIIFIKR